MDHRVCRHELSGRVGADAYNLIFLHGIIMLSGPGPVLCIDSLKASNSESGAPNQAIAISLAGQTYLLRWRRARKGKIRLVYLAEFP